MTHSAVGRMQLAGGRAGRSLLVALALIAIGSGASPGSAAAQGAPPRTLQDSLEAARRERLALEAAVERQLAAGMAERARALAMSPEATALLRLEALLDSAQHRLTAQRDRIRQLRDATVPTDKAVLVIMLKAEGLAGTDFGATLVINGVQRGPVAFAPDRVRALAGGAAEELYRGDVPPGDQRIMIAVAGQSLTATETIAMPVALREVRYVEFALRGGRLVPTSWISRAASP